MDILPCVIFSRKVKRPPDRRSRGHTASGLTGKEGLSGTGLFVIRLSVP